MHFPPDESIALVVEPFSLLGFFADFKQLASRVLDTVSALRGHHAPQKISHAAITATALLGERRTLDAELIFEPGRFSSRVAMSARTLGSNRARGEF
jgi:hypothetical protein